MASTPESGGSKLRGPRCKAKTKAGKRCQALAGADGLCTAHSGRQDMKALGRRGGRARRNALAKLPPKERQSLREYLRDVVDPADVWQALKAALESGSQTAVVSAARLLVTELYEDRKEEDDRERMKQAGADARAKLDDLVRRRAASAHHAGRSGLAKELEQAARELWAEGEKAVTSGGVVVRDVSASDARAVLQGLVERGLIRPPADVGEVPEVERLPPSADSTSS